MARGALIEPSTLGVESLLLRPLMTTPVNSGRLSMMPSITGVASLKVRSSNTLTVVAALVLPAASVAVT